MKKIILTAIICVMLGVGHLTAFVYANHTCEAYNTCEDDGNRSEAPTLGRLIIEGACYFLKSQAHMLLLLDQAEVAELNGPDYPAMQTLAETALENMQKAADTYKNLIAAAKETPYNPEVISRLLLCDYESFKETNCINREIFARVEYFLKKGDITGLYGLLKSDMDAIDLQLQTIKAGIDAGNFPAIPLLWQLNETYSQSLLAGQYTARLFKSLSL